MPEHTFETPFAVPELREALAKLKERLSALKSVSNFAYGDSVAVPGGQTLSTVEALPKDAVKENKLDVAVPSALSSSADDFIELEQPNLLPSDIEQPDLEQVIDFLDDLDFALSVMPPNDGVEQKSTEVLEAVPELGEAKAPDFAPQIIPQVVNDNPEIIRTPSVSFPTEVKVSDTSETVELMISDLEIQDDGQNDESLPASNPLVPSVEAHKTGKIGLEPSAKDTATPKEAQGVSVKGSSERTESSARDANVKTTTVEHAQAAKPELGTQGAVKPDTTPNKTLEQAALSARRMSSDAQRDPAQNEAGQETAKKTPNTGSETLSKSSDVAQNVARTLREEWDNRVAEPSRVEFKKAVQVMDGAGKSATKNDVLDGAQKDPVIAKPAFQAMAVENEREVDLVTRASSAFAAAQSGIMRAVSKDRTTQTVAPNVLYADVSLTSNTGVNLGSPSQSSLADGRSEAGLEKWVERHLDLGSRGYVNSLARTIVGALAQGQQRLALTLTPASLGRINLSFIQKAGGLDLRIQAERKATISLLGEIEGKLVSSLENSGHKVNTVSYANAGTGGKEFSFDQNSPQDGSQQADQSSNTIRKRSQNNTEDSVTNETQSRTSGGEGRVNITV